MTAARIRPAVLSDADRIGEINVVTWRAAYAGLISAEVLGGLSIDQRAENWRVIIGGGDDVRVAVVEEQTAGYASFGACRDDDLSAAAGELYAIYVDPRFWDRGVGHQLHEDAIERMNTAGFDGATLWVLDSNERAISFYQRHGWVSDGAVKDDMRGAAVLRELRFRRA